MQRCGFAQLRDVMLNATQCGRLDTADIGLEERPQDALGRTVPRACVRGEEDADRLAQPFAVRLKGRVVLGESVRLRRSVGELPAQCTVLGLKFEHLLLQVAAPIGERCALPLDDRQAPAHRGSLTCSRKISRQWCPSEGQRIVELRLSSRRCGGIVASRLGFRGRDGCPLTLDSVGGEHLVHRHVERRFRQAGFVEV